MDLVRRLVSEGLTVVPVPDVHRPASYVCVVLAVGRLRVVGVGVGLGVGKGRNKDPSLPKCDSARPYPVPFNTESSSGGGVGVVRKPPPPLHLPNPPIEVTTIRPPFGATCGMGRHDLDRSWPGKSDPKGGEPREWQGDVRS